MGGETVGHGERTEPAQGTVNTCMTMVYVTLCSHIFGVLSEYFSNREVKVKGKK